MSSALSFFRAIRTITVVLCIGGLLSLTGAQPAESQYFGWFDSWSPLVWFPSVEGDVKARLMWVSVGGGSFSGTSSPGPVSDGGSLRGTFHLNKEELFLDSMVRFQVSRVSVRVGYDQRDFAGYRPPGVGETRFSYSGLRLGGDFDVVLWNRTRLGFDLDYDFFNPTFLFPSLVPGNPIVRFSGPNALTVGFHAIYNPLRTFCGASPIVEVRARWPVQGSQVTDWEISGGVASPSTMLGSFSLKGGYRSTQISYSADEVSAAGVAVGNPRFDVVLDGWFAEFAFYY